MSNFKYFQEEYVFYGSHADKVIKLTNKIDNKSGVQIFNSSIELFIMAALIGCIRGSQAKKERGSTTTKIFPTQFSNRYNIIMDVYKLVLLVGDYATLSEEERINRAFRHWNCKENFEYFESFLLGGIDEIYEVFFLNRQNVRYEDYLNSLLEFLSEFSSSINISVEDRDSLYDINDEL